jgi:hypothetical protein|tara:strand:- start:1219 stop:1614 length:396 start_codon:yes stop_codon:yes gene_type:complete
MDKMDRHETARMLLEAARRITVTKEIEPLIRQVENVLAVEVIQETTAEAIEQILRDRWMDLYEGAGKPELPRPIESYLPTIPTLDRIRDTPNQTTLEPLDMPDYQARRRAWHIKRQRDGVITRGWEKNERK